jgi:hypothetical protein
MWNEIPPGGRIIAVTSRGLIGLIGMNGLFNSYLSTGVETEDGGLPDG